MILKRKNFVFFSSYFQGHMGRNHQGPGRDRSLCAWYSRSHFRQTRKIQVNDNVKEHKI